jgi:hypothetical protein
MFFRWPFHFTKFLNGYILKPRKVLKRKKEIVLQLAIKAKNLAMKPV